MDGEGKSTPQEERLPRLGWSIWDELEKHMRKLVAALSAAMMVLSLGAVLTVAPAAALSTVTVTQNTTTWTQDDTRAGGAVAWSGTYGAPAGLGTSALELTTDSTNAAKAGLYTHTMSGTPLSSVTDLSYWTYQASGSAVADASFQLQIDPGCGNVSPVTLVFEPYWNGTVAPNTWQQWDVSGGQFWSSKTTDCPDQDNLTSGAGGPPFYTLADVVAMFPNAVVTGIGVNIGTYNPGWDVATDGVQFNDTVYNFELGTRPTSKDQCKEDGWMTVQRSVVH